MTSTPKTLFIILALIVELFSFGYLATEAREAGDGRFKQATVVTSPMPERVRLRAVSFVPVVVQGETIGRLAVYDDPATKRPADYLEFYNTTDDLLAVNWFDRFGIERMVVDRGVLQGGGRVEKVFVVVLDGEVI